MAGGKRLPDAAHPGPPGGGGEARLHRRRLDESQRAMAPAMIAPEPESAKQRRGGATKILAAYEGDERNATRVAINKARVVHKFKPLLAQEVLAGPTSTAPMQWPTCCPPTSTAGTCPSARLRWREYSTRIIGCSDGRRQRELPRYARPTV